MKLPSIISGDKGEPRQERTCVGDQPMLRGSCPYGTEAVLACSLDRSFLSLRYRPGGCPNSRLNARLKAASDSYPTSAAISATPRDVLSRDRAASCSLQRVKYVMGGSERYRVKRSTRADLEMPTAPARSAMVHGWATRLWSKPRLFPTIGSRVPASHPVCHSGKPAT